MKPRLAPLAAGCMAESGSRLPQSRDFVANFALVRPIYFHAVGQWFENFQQTTDAEVKRLIEDARTLEPASGGGSRVDRTGVLAP